MLNSLSNVILRWSVISQEVQMAVYENVSAYTLTILG